jgi:hypothetical protein
MILGQPCQVVVQRVQRSRREDAVLAHCPAHAAAVPIRRCHQYRRAREQRSARRAQTFAEGYGPKSNGAASS